MSILKCDALSIGYGGVNVIKDLSFSVQMGDFLTIVGENGVGKSTLVKALMGFIGATKGRIIFENGLSHSGIGYLPQQSEAQKDFPASVFEIVRSGRLGKKGFNPFYTREDNRLALRYMEMLDLVKFKDKSYRELSGGQQQRVLLARALCSAEKILLLDEPVSGLDSIVAAEFYALVSKLNKDGVTVIMVSHDIQAAVRYSNRVLHITKQGAFFGSVEEYVQSDSYKMFIKEGVPKNEHN